MAVVADRGLGGALAGAQQRAPGALGGPFDRTKRRALVRAVAERLALRAAARAPPVGLARHQVDLDRHSSADRPLVRLVSHCPLPLRRLRATPRRSPWRVRAPAGCSSGARSPR